MSFNSYMTKEPSSKIPKNVLQVDNRTAFREWLEIHHEIEKECWVSVKRGKPSDSEHFWYLDAVEEALCFGWIDSTNKIIDGQRMQRFSPRQIRSHWTELNKERVRRLGKLGLMTEAGLKVLPKDILTFKIDSDIEAKLKIENVWDQFKSFPELYQRVRASNIAFYKKESKEIFNQMLSHLIEKTREGVMFGEWNDYGRLINY